MLRKKREEHKVKAIGKEDKKTEIHTHTHTIHIIVIVQWLS